MQKRFLLKRLTQLYIGFIVCALVFGPFASQAVFVARAQEASEDTSQETQEQEAEPESEAAEESVAEQSEPDSEEVQGDSEQDEEVGEEAGEDEEQPEEQEEALALESVDSESETCEDGCISSASDTDDGEEASAFIEGESGNASTTGDGATATASTEQATSTGEDAVIVTEDGGVIEAHGGEHGDAGGDGGGALLAPDTVISTGGIFATADVANVVNTNAVNSSGTILFINKTGTSGDIDVRAGNFSVVDCNAQETCEATQTDVVLEVTNVNEAVIDNDVEIVANTGANTIANASGTGEIVTGDAMAAANVVNIANTNLVDSQYLLLVLNNFGDLSGDIVLPGKDFFAFLGGPVSEHAGESSTTITNSNDATVTNDLGVVAESGGNTASGTDASITTGNSHTFSGVTNVLNTNLVNQDSIYILLKVSGDWNGEIFGLPDSLMWERTDEGIVFYAAQTHTNSTVIVCDEDDDECETTSSTTIITNDNTATIDTTLTVAALTGENTIAASASGTLDATIETGDAMAVANVVNVANTNVVSSNWLLALINIFGNWNGNLSFGRPDLWIAQNVELDSNPLTENGKAVVTISVKNRGDARATNVQVTEQFAPDDLLLTTEPLEWDLGTLVPGEEKTIQFTATASSTLPEGDTAVALTARVDAREPDGDPLDNTDVVTITVHGESDASGGNGDDNGDDDNGGSGGSDTDDDDDHDNDTDGNTGGSSGDGSDTPQLTIEKTNNAPALIFPGDSVHFTITIVNTGDEPLLEAVVTDLLRDPNGSIIATNQWDLGTIAPDEEVILEYDAVFSVQAVSGVYHNSATLSGRTSSGEAVLELVALSSVTVNDLSGQGGADIPDDGFIGTAQAARSVPAGFFGGTGDSGDSDDGASAGGIGQFRNSAVFTASLLDTLGLWLWLWPFILWAVLSLWLIYRWQMEGGHVRHGPRR